MFYICVHILRISIDTNICYSLWFLIIITYCKCSRTLRSSEYTKKKNDLINFIIVWVVILLREINSNFISLLFLHLCLGK